MKTRIAYIAPYLLRLPLLASVQLPLLALFVSLIFGSNVMRAQTFSSGTTDDLIGASDSLALREEWWIGGNLFGFYQQNFGVLTARYVGSEAPGAVQLYANTEGGNGFGAGAGPMVEYRPFRSPIAFGLLLTGELRTFRSESTTPIKNDIFAFNATFETHATAWYATISPYVRYQLNAAGAYALCGITVDVPVAVTDSYVWQHELQKEGETPGVDPGHATTSIKFKTDIDMRVRFGMQLGFGHDFMVGLFGYKNQLISPYIVIQGGTPIVSSPTALNGLMARVGVLWKYGL